MTVDELINKINRRPDEVAFDEVIATIETHYVYTPATFSNGLGDNRLVNQAGTNEGSCKIFAFAKRQGLNEKQTLNCFGKYYREDVLKHPDANDHGNIRQFMLTGWGGIEFEEDALVPV